MIAGSGQGSGSNKQETLGTGNGRIGIKGLRSDKFCDLGMLGRGLQILAHGQKIDVCRAHVIHDLMNFHAFLTQSQHHAGFGEDRRVVPLYRFQQAQRGIIACAGADCRIEPGHGFKIVVVNVGTSFDDRLHRAFDLVAKIGRQDFDCGRRGVPTQRLDDLHKLARTAIGQVIAIHRSNHDMLQPHFCSRYRNMFGLKRIDGAGHARLDVAKCAGAGANITEDHHRRMLLGPALADIRARRFFTHRCEIEVAHQFARLIKTCAGRGLYPDPIGFALTRSGANGCGIVHGRPDSDAIAPCQPFRLPILRSEIREAGHDRRNTDIPGNPLLRTWRFRRFD